MNQSAALEFVLTRSQDEVVKKIVELSSVIDTLNERTAAADVAEMKHLSEVAELTHQLAAARESAEREVQVAQNNAAETNNATLALYNAQNAYVIALENRAAGDVAAALNSHRRAEIRCQILSLQAQLSAS